MQIYLAGSNQQQMQQENQMNRGSSHDNLQDVYEKTPPRRPTLSNLSPSEAANVNTPEELLEHCCRFPACYDPLYELCIDTCR